MGETGKGRRWTLRSVGVTLGIAFMAGAALHLGGACEEPLPCGSILGGVSSNVPFPLPEQPLRVEGVHTLQDAYLPLEKKPPKPVEA